ncbi:NAD(P)-dependent oxidoreductase [Oscillospiraceae bacterium MB08-C2-2]|nr:NAD(P)-dependent oxidoreductase [Oscillospiraceae bacterium MB08-C2-2]
MSKHVIEDARRCLQCKNPQCSVGCPVHTPIRDAIKLLLESKIGQAGKLLFDNNPLSLVCCHVCSQENQCEGHCILGRKGSPVQISAIERYISDYYLNIFRPTPSKKTKGRIAIIGSGPAGITIAFTLSKMDYDVTIFEGHDQIGGVLRYGIPEFRLPKDILDRLKETLLESGVKIRPNTSIGTNLTIDDLFRDGYRAIFVGTGVWRPQKLGILGESLGHVHYAIEYLRNPNVYKLGKRLAVIGAGNVAMDVARTAFRQGCEEVYILCNMDETTITARPVEADYAKIDGARFIFYKTVVEFVDEGVIVADSRVWEDEDGRKQAEPIPGTEELFPADSVIVAIGQGPRSVIVSSTTGMKVLNNGLVATDEFGHTSRPGVFASGDVVTGAKTVVEAVDVSRRVAGAMDEYVQSQYPTPKS